MYRSTVKIKISPSEYDTGAKDSATKFAILDYNQSAFTITAEFRQVCSDLPTHETMQPDTNCMKWLLIVL